MSDEFDFENMPEEEADDSAAGITLEQRRARKESLTRFYIASFTAVVIGAILLCIFVFFRVDTVEIIGGESYRQEDILSVCNIQDGDNLVLLSTADREKELEYRFPYIENVEIKKRIPARVEVVITETKTSYSIACEEGYLYVNYAGKVLEVAKEPAPDSAVVRGTTPTATGPSQIIGFEEEDVSLIFSEIINQLKEKDVAGITSIDMSNRYDVTMMYDDRILFKFGNTNGMQSKMAYGIETLNYMINEGSITGETHGEIDLTMVPDKKKVVYGEVVPGQEEVSKVEGVAGRSPSAMKRTQE